VINLKNIISILTVGLLLTGCSSPADKYRNKINYYSHPDYGVVDEKKPAYVTDRDECQTKAYSKGIKIDGVLVTTRDEVYTHYIKFLSGELSSEISASRYSTSNNGTRKPYYYKKMESYDNEAEQCIKVKGWVKVENK
jgi:hypothetical protein